MKKTVIIVLLIALLFSMSSAYAVWTDSASVSVTASNAIIAAGYTDRNSNPQKIQYTVQSLEPLSTDNPYLHIEETIKKLTYKQNTQSGYEVVYTITNTGEVPISFDGIKVLSKSVNYNSPLYTDTIRIEYTISNTFAVPSYSYTAVISDFDSFSGVTFANSENNVLNVGEYCTMTVTYYRVSSGDKEIDKAEIIITKTDQLSCSVYR